MKDVGFDNLAAAECNHRSAPRRPGDRDLPRQIDQPDQPSTLPQAELNPLLNPLLSQNMGRWAEVYFTSPPEKREQAVHELLRELESQRASGEDAVPTTPPQQLSGEEVSNGSRLDESHVVEPESSLICHSCGHESTPDQRFCGMCGVALAESSHSTDHRVAEHPAFVRNDERPSFALENEPEHFVHQASANETPAEAAPQEWDTTPPLHADKRFDHGDDALDHMFGQSQPSFSYTYRIFIGGALAIILVTLAYMAWRSGQAASGLSQAAPPPTPVSSAQPAAPAPDTPSPVTPSPATRAPGASTTNSDSSADRSSDHTAAAKNPPPAREEITPEANKKVNREAEIPRTPIKVASRTLRAPTPAEKATPAQSMQGNGSEELATAQSYLNGSNGPRNPSAAVDWLWKAIAKRNGEATILLSDLYLKGDGIPKNCDQARVLLDAAARNGRKDAVDRLRNMQAFGCQ